MGCADTGAVDGWRGSNVYELNPWLWQFGRWKPRLGGLDVVDTKDRKETARLERQKRGAETRQCRRDERV
jgi:hypothetical protein